MFPLTCVMKWGFIKFQASFTNKEQRHFKSEGDTKELISKLFAPSLPFVISPET